jgi:chromosome segregation ATPase
MAKVEALSEQIRVKDLNMLEIETQSAQYRQQISQLEISARHNSEDVSRLSQELEKAKAEGKQVKEELDIMSSTRDRLLKRSKVLEDEVAVLEVSCMKLKRDVEEKASTIDSKHADIRALNGKIKEYEDHSLLNKTVVTDVSNVKEKYAALEVQVSLLHSEKVNSIALYEDKRKECEQLQQNINSLQKECDDKEKRLQQYKERAMEWQDRFLSVEAELLRTRSSKPLDDNNNNNNNNNNKDVTTVNDKELQSAQEEIEKKQVQVRELEGMLSVERCSNSTNEKQLSECRSEIISLQRQLIMVGNKANQTTPMVSCSNCESMKSYIDELKKHRIDSGSLDDAIAAMEAEKVALHAQNSAITSEVNRLQTDMLHKDLLIKDATAANQSLQNEITVLKATIESKVSEIKALTSTIAL